VCVCLSVCVGLASGEDRSAELLLDELLDCLTTTLTDVPVVSVSFLHLSSHVPLVDLGFFRRVGDFGNPSERSQRALRGSGLTGE